MSPDEGVSAERPRGEAPRRFDRSVVLGNLKAIHANLALACERAGRDPGEVDIVAAAKHVPVEPIRWVVDAGTIDVGQNYVKELAATRDGVPGARWHFIGTLQSGTAHKVADLADVVQTLASARATERLSRRADERGRSIEVLLEVDLTGARGGLAPERVLEAADRVAGLPALRLTGLMTLPPFNPDPEAARPYFVRLRELAERVRRDHPDVRGLSMGMSLDYQVAAAEGATMVRIGTRLFGERPHRH